MLLGELQKPLRRFLGLPLKQKMRPFKGAATVTCGLIRRISSRHQAAYKTVLFHLDIQDGYSNLFQFRKRVSKLSLHGIERTVYLASQTRSQHERK